MNNSGNVNGNRLVAHRGDHEQVPENSLAAFKQALDNGALWLECDIQFTQDGVPVVFHDPALVRMCGVDKPVVAMACKDLPPLLDGQGVPLLQELLELLAAYPLATLFLEIKREILPHYGIANTIATLAPMLADNPQVVPISMSAELLETWRESNPVPLGWVTAGDPPKIDLDYLLMPADAYMRGERPVVARHIAVYTVNDADYAQELLRHGADLVETDHFSRLQQAFKTQ